MGLRPSLRSGLVWLLLCCALLPGRAHAEGRQPYLRYVPFSYPKIVRETEPNAEFQLFGKTDDPSYRDEAPRDGIDDTREQLLQALAVRFAPYMVQNTTLYPMDFHRTMEVQHTDRLFVDRWNIATSPQRLARSTAINLSSTAASPCPEGASAQLRQTILDAIETAAPLDDCHLLALLRDFDPEHPTDPFASTLAADPRKLLFTVMFFDFPGTTPSEWKAEYQNPLSGQIPRRYRDLAKTYVHPFISRAAETGYEFVLQYWFFYPMNDAGNKHQGDWEHVNVIVSPLSRIGRPLSAEDIRTILARSPTELGGPDPLVVAREEYYLHEFVMPVDFSEPNVYAPRTEWEATLRKRKSERVGETEMLESIRYRAWQDAAETIPNTHPIVFIGADSKGPELMLYGPGAHNQDSHASYPFSGRYKGIGPAAASEQVTKHFDFRRYLGPKAPPLPEGVVALDMPERVELLPDWERIQPLVLNEPAIRQRWSWMLLPIRWGYPAIQSPFAGIISHAETGNLSPVGPTFSRGWNNTGPAGFALYEPHRFHLLFPTSPLDLLQNSFGYLNIPLVLIATLPPFDLVAKLVVSPLSKLAGSDPEFYPTQRVPFRFFTLGGGVSWQVLSDDWALLFFNTTQGNEIMSRVMAAGTPVAAETVISNPFGPILEVAFHLSPHWAVENLFRYSNSDIGVNILLSNNPEVFKVRGNLRYWEWAGSIRYNILTGGFQPFLKLGYGLSWYQLQNVTTNGVPLANTSSVIFRQPSLSPFQNIFPNTWHFGLGVEFIPIKSIAPLPRGIDFSIKAEFALYTQSLGLTFEDRALLGLNGNDPTVHRPVFDLLALVSF